MNEETRNLDNLVRTVTAHGGYTKLINVGVEQVSRGKVIMTLRKRPELVQFNGNFHGGVLAGLADHAAGAAVSTSCPPGKIAVTVDLQISFLRAARCEMLSATATTLRLGGLIGVARVEICDPSDPGREMLTHATATMRVVDAPFDI